MGSDLESVPKLSLFSMAAHLHDHEPSGMLTPPLQNSASVPFRWEEEPGKPRPCTQLINDDPTLHSTRCLELPPRLAMPESSFTPSPTTVLDGPRDSGGRSVFSSSSFRFSTERRRRGSFDGSCSGGWSPYDGDGGGGGGLQQLLSGNKKEHQKSLFGSFRLTGKDDRKVSFVISPTSTSTSSSMETGGFFEEKKMRRNSSLSKLPGSHFWATIYKGFKQAVVPWKKKPSRETFNL